jgi:asparagine synthase (glutamine-hydrolysing)
MSIIFGIRKSERGMVTEPQLLDLARATNRWARDGTFVNVQGPIGMGFQPYHTHQRSNIESQPSVDQFGNMVTLDGRLDNHKELRELLEILESDTPDSLIALAAFRRWGEECFGKFVGDWAIAIWSQMDDSVYLARDHAGTRTLYYAMTGDVLVWATYLETLFGDKNDRQLDEQYAASYLACQPVRDLTPFKGIESITPAHYLVFHRANMSKRRHWSCPRQEDYIALADTEVEERFFSLFRQAVERRTGEGAPIIAELSGGMDSSSIVCMSDWIRIERDARTASLIDTVSLFDTSEPNWNEVPYFSLVEQQRGKKGVHIESLYSSFTLAPAESCKGCYLFPGADSQTQDQEDRFDIAINASRQHRITLSGIGGDELTGGVPTPLPELANYLVRGDFRRLFRSAVSWCLTTRKPLTWLLYETATFTWNVYRTTSVAKKDLPPWLLPKARRACLELATTDESNALTGRIPSCRNNQRVWQSLLEVLPHRIPRLLNRYEYRYPFLDRDLVEFLFRVPRNQLLRPGRRRSLMRRALNGVVPAGILERRRKAFRIRGPLVLLRDNHQRLEQLFDTPRLEIMGMIDSAVFRESIRLALEGHDPRWLHSLFRAIHYELWHLSTMSPNLISTHSSSTSTHFAHSW